MRVFLFLSLLVSSSLFGEVKVGADRIFEEAYIDSIKGKSVGLITNQTGVNSSFVSTIDLLKKGQKTHGYTLKALFAPEHGLYGEGYAEEHIASGKTPDGIPIHSLHGATRRPTKEMLKGLDVIVFDIQDVGSRPYTYAGTLFYAMEEAAKAGIRVVVLDRPNPLGGNMIDGPMLEPEFRSFVGYINVPYCHGMTIGEMALLFNEEYKVGCDVTVVPMKGWKRSMRFSDTGLHWIPTSPNIPESSTALYFPATGLLGQLSFVSIGIGYTLPFKVVAAPWIDGTKFANALNAANLPGVRFVPTLIKPFMSSFQKKPCSGVLLIVTDRNRFLPVTTQYAILSTIKRMYPTALKKGVQNLGSLKDIFLKVCGTKKIYELLQQEKMTFQELRGVHQKERAEFLKRRKPYLLADYN